MVVAVHVAACVAVARLLDQLPRDDPQVYTLRIARVCPHRVERLLRVELDDRAGVPRRITRP